MFDNKMLDKLLEISGAATAGCSEMNLIASRMRDECECPEAATQLFAAAQTLNHAARMIARAILIASSDTGHD